LPQTVIHAPCDPDYYDGEHWDDQARGVTTWNLNNEFTVKPILMPYNEENENDCSTVVFTCDLPECYAAFNTISRCGDTNVFGLDACVIVFNAWRTGSDTANTDVQLKYFLNGDDIGGSNLSEVSTHGATQGFDVANIGCTFPYNDRGRNTLIFQNNSNSTIQLDHVKVIRTYKMCNPHAQEGNWCTFDFGEGPCYEGTSNATSGSFDATRTPTPCLCDGGGLSYTHLQDTTHQGRTLEAGKTMTWTFNFGTLPDNPHVNYAGKSICICDFNYMEPMSTVVSGDVALQAWLNGTLINTYYLSGRGLQKGMAPSHDLAQEDDYGDTISNTIELRNLSTIDVKMVAIDSGIDLYRLYQTSTIECCEQCETCQTCQEQCEICETCNTACEATCVTCITCYSCYVACQDCQACEASCQTECELECQDCQTGCEVACQSCYMCYMCYICYSWYT
jgi:hypothetical protein